jgi:DNA-binding CsgD family transcriptional regulator
VATRPNYARAAERVVQVCGAHDDAQALRLALLDAIRRATPFDAHAWLLTDPETEVGCAPIADVPPLVELPRLIRLKYLASVNRWTALDPAVATLGSARGHQDERSLIWREFLAGHGVTDIASVVFRDKFGCWGFLDLWRIGGSGPRFTEPEAEFLRQVAQPIAQALRVAQARTFEIPTSSLDRSGPVVLVLSPELLVRTQTAETEQYLRVLVPPEAERRPIPAVAYNVGAQLLALEAGVDDHPPSARVHLAGGVWVTVRAARMGETAPANDRDIAVTIESASPEERTELLARTCGLSLREAELLGHLTTGGDTRRIAELMFLSEHTVQDHLKSIFDKTGARNRRTLLARALGR